MTFTLDPFRGASPLRFGDSPLKVTQLVGEPDSVNRLDALEEWRGAVITRYRADQLDELSFGWSSVLLYAGTNLVAAPDLVHTLRSHDSRPLVSDAGGVYFPTLGLLVASVHDPDPAERVVTVLTRETFRHLQTSIDMRPLSQ